MVLWPSWTKYPEVRGIITRQLEKSLTIHSLSRLWFSGSLVLFKMYIYNLGLLGMIFSCSICQHPSQKLRRLFKTFSLTNGGHFFSGSRTSAMRRCHILSSETLTSGWTRGRLLRWVFLYYTWQISDEKANCIDYLCDMGKFMYSCMLIYYIHMWLSTIKLVVI